MKPEAATLVRVRSAWPPEPDVHPGWVLAQGSGAITSSYLPYMDPDRARAPSSRPTDGACRPKASRRCGPTRPTTNSGTRPAVPARPRHEALSSMGIAQAIVTRHPPLSRRGVPRLAAWARAAGAARPTACLGGEPLVERRPHERHVQVRQRERPPRRAGPRSTPSMRTGVTVLGREEPRRLDQASSRGPAIWSPGPGPRAGSVGGRRAPRRRVRAATVAWASSARGRRRPAGPSRRAADEPWNCVAQRIRTGSGPSRTDRSWARFAALSPPVNRSVPAIEATTIRSTPSLPALLLRFRGRS